MVTFLMMPEKLATPDLLNVKAFEIKLFEMKP